MKPFKAVFQIIENNNCRLYEKKEFFTLTEKHIALPEGKVGCLILIREMTQLLIQLLNERGKEGKACMEYSCSGCSGIIKFVQVPDEEQIPTDLEHLPSITDEEQILFDKIVQYPLLRDIPVNHLKEFLGCFNIIKLMKGEVLIEKGQPIKHLFIILSGNLTVEDEGIRIATLEEGEVCGEMSYFGDNIASTSVRAEEEAEIISISGEDFGRLIKVSDSVHDYMVRILAKRLANANSVRVSDLDFGMHGRVNEMTPAELLQIFHMHQKTGVLFFDLPKGSGNISFRDGAIVVADYAGISGQDAVFAVLAEKEGVYSFTNGLPEDAVDKPVVGDFMMLLMEGVRRIDEEE